MTQDAPIKSARNPRNPTYFDRLSDETILRILNSLCSIWDLGPTLSISERILQVYRAHDRSLLWKYIRMYLGPDGTNDLLICAISYTLSSVEEFDLLMKKWARTELAPEKDAAPDGRTIAIMAQLFFSTVNFINWVLAQMQYAQELWGQLYGIWPRLLREMCATSGLRDIRSEDKRPWNLSSKRTVFRTFFLSWTVFQAYGVQSFATRNYGRAWFGMKDRYDLREVSRVLCRFEACRELGKRPGSILELLSRKRHYNPILPENTPPHLIIADWLDPQPNCHELLRLKESLQTPDYVEEQITSCQCVSCLKCNCPTCKDTRKRLMAQNASFEIITSGISGRNCSNGNS
ncbi:hypothetical protein FZEAL_4977 [Fusarium zealandicum]|uniref:Uncharacterized protein n=1 Tax=Fusarium zealandicum TaxID=1053134 RepID=A0A8H4UKQ2_9HYPO|nr:hypothetical protein FZEAL_4977 [Fusarium zealandicum]